MNTTARRHDIDALRVIAFGLLILYHCGMFYVADWGWHVKSEYLSVWLQEPMRFVNQWRMSLLFVISGLAVSFVWDRYTPGQLSRRRLWRLGLPLIFGMVVVVVPQPYFEALNKGIIEPGFFKFWYQYLTFHDFPGEAWGGENFATWTWNHLWYLPYVLCYTLLLAAIGAVARRPLLALQQRIQRLSGPGILLLPIVPLMLYANFVFPSFPYIDHGLFNDFYAHALYGTLFLFGFLIGKDPQIWTVVSRLRKHWLVIGLVSYALLRSQDLWVDENTDGLLEQISFLVLYVNRWVWILVLLSWAHIFLNRPARWLTYASGAVFPWYVLHQSITISAGYLLSQYKLGPVVEPILVVAATILGCALLYELVIRRIRWLRPLFGAPILGTQKQPKRV